MEDKPYWVNPSFNARVWDRNTNACIEPRGKVYSIPSADAQRRLVKVMPTDKPASAPKAPIKVTSALSVVAQATHEDDDLVLSDAPMIKTPSTRKGK